MSVSFVVCNFEIDVYVVVYVIWLSIVQRIYIYIKMRMLGIGFGVVHRGDLQTKSTM